MNKVGRPKGKLVRRKNLIKSAIKHDGSPAAVARDLGVTPQTAQHHLEKPEIKEIIQRTKAEAIKEARIDRVRIYKRLNEGLDAITTTMSGKKVPNYRERRENSKLLLQLLGDLNGDETGMPRERQGIIIRSALPDGSEQIVDMTYEK